VNDSNNIVKKNDNYKNIIIIGLFIIIGSLIISITLIILNNKKNEKKYDVEDLIDDIDKADEAAARTSTLGYIDSIEYYVGFAQANGTSNELGLDDYDASLLPGDAVCIKKDKYSDWNGGKNDICNGFMNAVEKKNYGTSPDSAYVIISEDGYVQDNSKFEFNGYNCTYYSNNVICE
jgi:hypothetical protein